MEILFITHKYPPSVGGMEKQSYELINRSRAYAKVHTIAWIKGNEPKWKFFLNLKARIKTTLDLHPGIGAIHLNDGLMAMVCHWLPDYTNIPTIVTLHGLDVVYPLPFFQNRIKRYYSKFTRLITVSQATKQELINRGIDGQKIVTIHNGVDHQLDTSIGEKKILESYAGIDLTGKTIITGVGRQVKRKGFSWFLEHVLPYTNDNIFLFLIGPFQPTSWSAKMMRMVLPNTILNHIDLLFGNASDQDSIASLIKSHPGLKDKVVHLHNCTYGDVMNILAQSSLMIMPNVKVHGDAEGFGLVALEAAINKTPVLASDLEGIRDAVTEGKNGWLIPSGDVLRWINKINLLSEHKEMIDEMGIKAQQYTRTQFGWDKMAIEYLEEVELLQSLHSTRKYNYKLKPSSIAV